MQRFGLLSLMLICGLSQPSPAQVASPRLTNQEVAENIAAALQQTDLKGMDVTIEVQRGQATLTGFVANADQQKLAEEVTSRIEGVTQVVNSLMIAPEGKGDRGRYKFQTLNAVPFQIDSSKKLTNQEVAEMIAAALHQANLQGNGIDIKFQGGVATLTGSVMNVDQRELAGQVTARIIGVDEVENRLQVNSGTGVSEAGRDVPKSDSSQNQADEGQLTEASGPGLSGDSSAVIPASCFELSAEQHKIVQARNRVGMKLLDRQKELFASETLRRIEVRSVFKDESTPLYDIYCGKHRLVVVSRCGGSNYASYEGTILNSYQGGLYEWTSGKPTGTQYECERCAILQNFNYSLDPGGFITSLYQSFAGQPDLFKEPIERKDGTRELQLKQPLYHMLSIVVSEDPLWFHELKSLNKDGEHVKRVYSSPTDVDVIPQSIQQELKEVAFKPTKRTVYSLMPYP